jgi:hypothetical protein
MNSKNRVCNQAAEWSSLELKASVSRTRDAGCTCRPQRCRTPAEPIIVGMSGALGRLYVQG